MEFAEQQVWKRVMSRQEQGEGSPLGQLAFLSRESAGVYRELLPRTKGAGRRLLQQLLEGEEENLACLRGLGKLWGVTVPHSAGNCTRECGWEALKCCWERSLCLLGEYTARSAMGSSGAVFRRMALRQECLCALLAELLGLPEQ